MIFPEYVPLRSWRSLRLWLHMMGDRQPATVDFLVDIGHYPIDLAGAAIFHLGEPAFGTDFPCKIANNVYLSINQRYGSLRTTHSAVAGRQTRQSTNSLVHCYGTSWMSPLKILRSSVIHSRGMD
jgi:hypothetical protein